jgi:hypothetical protein
MEKDLARHIVVASFRSFRELTALLPMLKEHCDNTEYESFAKAIAAVGFEIQMQVRNRAVALYPNLEQEIKTKIDKYGALI